MSAFARSRAGVIDRVERRGEIVRLRRLYLPLLVVLGAAVTVVLPAIAVSEPTPTVAAVNGGGIYGEPHAWSPPEVTLGEGGVVTFQSPSSTVPHGVEWVGGPAKPTCSSGVPVGTSAEASGTNWSGTCAFARPGVYTFYCTVHGPEMTGRITVNSNGTTTVTAPNMNPASPTSPGAATPLTSPPGESGSGAVLGSPLRGSASQAIKLAKAQHGKSVRGSVQVAQAGVGGRLEVDLLASGGSLAKVGHAAQVRVGRLVRSSLYAGAVSFAVPLSVKGKAALRRHRRLTLTVRIVVRPLRGAAVTVTRVVVVHDV